MLECTAVEKRSSLDFAHKILDLHQRRCVTVATDHAEDAAPPGARIVTWVATEDGGGWFNRSVAPIDEPIPAQISVSSGTTGKPKSLVLSHRALADVTGRLIAATGLDASAREYIGVPLTYSFGFGRIRAIAAVGGSAFIPSRGFRPDELARLLASDEVNALSAVPTMLRAVLQNPQILRGTGPKLRWLEIGSQYMAAAEKDAVRTLFPNAEIVQHYGLTEASRTTFLRFRHASLDALESVGAPNGDIEVRISSAGFIQIRGHNLADGMLTEAGLIPVADPDGWLSTSDKGELRDGLLYYHGRGDDVANVGGIKVSSEMFEAGVRGIMGEGIDFAITPIPDALRGDIILVAYAAGTSGQDVAALERAAESVSGTFNVPKSFVVASCDAIPRTPTGKVQRTQLRADYLERNPQSAAGGLADKPDILSRLQLLFTRQLYARALVEAGITLGFVSADWLDIKDVYAKLTGRKDIKSSDSFASIGGDSLTYIQTSMALEEYLGVLPPDWETLSIEELEGMRRGADVL